MARRPTRQASARCAGPARTRQPRSAERTPGGKVGRQHQGRRTRVRRRVRRALACSCTVRDARGREITAACGQLAAQA